MPSTTTTIKKGYCITGRVTNDRPHLSYTPQGLAVLKFYVNTVKKRIAKVIVFGKLAEAIYNKIFTDMTICVQGSVKERKWINNKTRKEGKDVYLSAYLILGKNEKGETVTIGN